MNIRGLARKVAFIAMATVLVMYVVASLVLAGTTGIISGVITDEAKGARLSGVNVTVRGLDMTAVSDVSGYYVITNVPPGTYEVTAGMVGYQDVAKTEVQVTMDATATADFAMTQAVTAEKEATVTVSRSLVHPDVVPTLYTATAKQEQMIITNPGSQYQVPALVASQPGVVTDPSTNIPHIRGGRDSQTGYMMEGISIVDPATNSFATNLVTLGMSKMQVYTGGYNAEYGNAIGGVLNEIKKTGRDVLGGSTQFIGGTQNYSGMITEYGNTSSRGLDYYVGSYVWQTDYDRWATDFVSPAVRNSDWADFVGKASYPISKNDKLTLLLGQGTGRVEMADPPSPLPPAENGNHNSQGYWLSGLSWSHNFNTSSFLTVRPYILNNRIAMGQILDVGGGMLVGFASNSDSQQKGVQVEYTNQMSEKHLFKTGLSLVGADSHYGDDYTLYFDDGSSMPYQTRGSDVKTLRFGGFLQDQMKLNDKLQMVLGVRQDSMRYDKQLFPDTHQSVFSPRLGLTYNSSPRNVWRCSWGKFAMFSPTSVTGMTYSNPPGDTLNSNDEPELSRSFDFGFERQVSANTLMRITPFQIDYSNILQKVSAQDPDTGITTSNYVNLGKGRTNGCEFYLQKKLSSNWEGWLSYTYMKARADANAKQEAPGGLTDFVNWDQRHTLVAASSFRKGPWAHTLDLQFGSGLYNRALSRRLGSHTIVNYAVSRKLPAGWLLGDSVQLSVSNLFNVGTPVQLDDFSGQPSAWVLPRFINLSVHRAL